MHFQVGEQPTGVLPHDVKFHIDGQLTQPPATEATTRDDTTASAPTILMSKTAPSGQQASSAGTEARPLPLRITAVATSPDRAATWQQGLPTVSTTATFATAAEVGRSQGVPEPNMQTSTTGLRIAPGVGSGSSGALNVAGDIPRHNPGGNAAASPEAETHGTASTSGSSAEILQGALAPPEELFIPSSETQQPEELLNLDRSVFSLDGPDFLARGTTFSIGERSSLPNGTNVRDLQTSGLGPSGFPQVVDAQGPGKLRRDVSGTSAPNNGLMRSYRYGSLQYGTEWWDDGPTRAGRVQPLYSCFKTLLGW